MAHLTALPLTPNQSINQLLVQLTVQAVQQLTLEPVQITVSYNTKGNCYQTPVAMQLAKLLRQKPQVIAQNIISKINYSDIQLNIVGPGFVTFTLSQPYMLARVQHLLQHGIQPSQQPQKKVALDFSSPNIAKQMHVGHLRSTIIGETLARVLEFMQHDVMRINHIGDWGTQFGMLIAHLQDSYEGFIDQADEEIDIGILTTIYKESKQRFDSDPEFKARAYLAVQALQQGQEWETAAWQKLCQVSMARNNLVYDRLQITLNTVGESFYQPMVPDLIEQLQEHLIEQDGCQILPVPGHNVPMFITKTGGAIGYDTTDLCALNYRAQTLSSDWLIYVVDHGQSVHFKTLFDAAQSLEWLEGKQVNHVAFGLVQGQDKKRLKSRSGDTIPLMDLLDEAVQRMETTLQARVEKTKQDIAEGKRHESTPMLNPNQILNAAKTIGYAAVKYFDLRRDPMSNYVFDYDQMLDVRGDTAVYLLYAYARLQSIIRKSGVDMEGLKRTANLVLTEPSEWALVQEVLKFQEVIELVVRTLKPNYLCDYLYQLCNSYTTFNHSCQVIQDNIEVMHSRLLLSEVVANTMYQCFHLLGIEPLDMI